MNRQTFLANTTTKTLSVIALLLTLLLAPAWLLAQTDNHRLIILADMGNEPDEVQQMVHMMMYSNEFDLEGLIAVTGKYLNPQQKDPYRRVLHPELFTGIIDAYGEVVENLKKHANGWPEVDYLHSIVATGQPEYGIAGTGEGKSTPGSELIVNSLVKNDDRPIYIVINAGSNTLAQALIDFRAEHSQRELDAVIPKLRVFENGAQDNAGAWICSKFPDIHWIRSNYQTYCYGGPMPETAEKLQLAGLKRGPHTWQPYAYSDLGQHQWTLEHVIASHGALGAHYPLRMMANKLFFLEGGGTIPWLGLIHRGLSSIDQSGWGGWSGRFTQEKVPNVWSRHKDVQQDEESYGEFKLYTEVADRWVDPATDSVYDHVFAPVYRWRQAFFNDFQCRMDWCVEDFEDANHNPVAAINGDQAEKIHIIRAAAGKTVQLDASASSDPDGDPIQYNWWIYQEAGTYPSPITLTDANQPVVSLPIPEDSDGQEIHLILEITDKNEIASLHDYRRVVFEVE